jgi:hypothetical protein
MYLFACRIKIKLKWFLSASNCKILYFTILIVCRKNLIPSDYTDCKITIIEGEEKVYLVECPNCCQCFEIK